MKNLKLLILAVALFFGIGASAQIYEADHWQADSIDVYVIEYNQIDGKPEEYVSHEVAFKIPNGEKIVVKRSIRNDDSYGVIVNGRKEYAVDKDDIIFSDENPEGTVDRFGDTRSEKQHSVIAHWFGDIKSYLIIGALVALAFVLSLIGVNSSGGRLLAIVGMPLLLLSAAVLEILAVYYVGNDAFWWCDDERYGFFGALWRVLPYVAFVGFQLYSLFLYAKIVGAGTENGMSMKPMIISLVSCIPVAVVVLIIMTSVWRDAPDYVHGIAILAAFLVTLLTGVTISTIRNIKEVGFLSGLAFSLFSIIYVIGAIVSVYGLAVIVFKLIFQVIVVILCFSVVMFLGGKK